MSVPRTAPSERAGPVGDKTVSVVWNGMPVSEAHKRNGFKIFSRSPSISPDGRSTHSIMYAIPTPFVPRLTI